VTFTRRAMARAIIQLATIVAAVLALAVPVPQAGASTPVQDQLTFFAFKPDPTSRTLEFRVEPLVLYRDLAWAFGDGTTASGSQPQHSFRTGTESFTVTLTAMFDDGSERTVSKVVQPGGQAPQLQLTPPPSDTTFAAGEPVHVSATAPEATEIRWITRLTRCGVNGCGSEYADPVLGAAYDVLYPSFGTQEIANPDTVYAYATGASGLSSSGQFELLAKQAVLNVGSSFPVNIKIDGKPVAKDYRGWPQQAFWTHVGSAVALEADPSTMSGVAPFQAWSDGNTSAIRSFVMPVQQTNVSADYLTPIEARYNSDAGLRSLLGPQTQPEDTSWGGSDLRRVTFYRNGRLHWSPSTGTHEVHGGIATLGIGPIWPITDELGTPDGVGRYNDFENRWSIYWTASTGAHSVHGGIGNKWREYGKELWLGYPTMEESRWTPENTVFQNFSKGGAIYWTAAGGAHEMHGGISAKFNSYGGYPFFGYPTTDETGTPDGVGRYNDFSRGFSIYWTPSTGTHEVHGGIRTKWRSLGAERSFLGYPTTDELYASGGARQNFQGGYILWNNATATATAYRY
jgi:LGFP repeat/PKD domain